MRDANVASQITLTSLELFAGAGGLALGVHSAGFQHLALVEWEPYAVQTLQANSQQLLNLDPDLVLALDARKIDYKPYAGKVDLLAGGPPCQPFSGGGLKNGDADPRDMFPAVFDVVALTKPRAILLENVRGLLRPTFDSYFAYIKARLRYPQHPPRSGEHWPDHLARLRGVKETDFPDEEQYVVSHQALDTADHGIPQHRHRVFITAFRRDLGVSPFELARTHSKEALLWEQCVTGEYWSRHGVDPYCSLDQSVRTIIERLRQDLFPPQSRPWRTVRDALSNLPDPVLRGKMELLANHTQHPGARSYGGHSGSCYDYPAKALKAGAHGTPGGENILRAFPGDTVRYFTTREAARLHTFPDEWRFQGSWGACIKQLGNAVPVEMGRLFAAEIRSRLLSQLGRIANDSARTAI